MNHFKPTTLFLFQYLKTLSVNVINQKCSMFDTIIEEKNFPWITSYAGILSQLRVSTEVLKMAEFQTVIARALRYQEYRNRRTTRNNVQNLPEHLIYSDQTEVNRISNLIKMGDPEILISMRGKQS